MANELSTQQTGALIQTIDQQGLGEMLKPLIRDIHLFDTYVAGTTHLEDKSILNEIKTGDKLSLQREKNKFDENAIEAKLVEYRKQKDAELEKELAQAAQA